MRFINKLNIDFIGKRYIFFATTLLMLGFSVVAFIIRGGPILSIEFTGGTMVQISFKELPPIEKIRSSLNSNGWQGFGLQTQPVNQSIVVRIKKGEKSQEDISNELITALKKDFSGNVKDIPDRVEFVGSVIGKGIVLNTIWALLGSFIGIIIYVAFRFKNWIWGFAGVIALVHDVLITWGLLTFLKAETTLVVIAALLTLVGYSINDTIVVFDRVRENIRTSRKESIKDLYNRSINETMTRTINTSMTVFLASLSLLFLGGVVLHDFAVAFSFGVLVGTYSSVGVALSLVYELERIKQKHE